MAQCGKEHWTADLERICRMQGRVPANKEDILRRSQSWLAIWRLVYSRLSPTPGVRLRGPGQLLISKSCHMMIIHSLVYSSYVDERVLEIPEIDCKAREPLQCVQTESKIPPKPTCVPLVPKVAEPRTKNPGRTSRG